MGDSDIRASRQPTAAAAALAARVSCGKLLAAAAAAALPPMLMASPTAHTLLLLATNVVLPYRGMREEEAGLVPAESASQAQQCGMRHAPPPWPSWR